MTISCYFVTVYLIILKRKQSQDVTFETKKLHFPLQPLKYEVIIIGYCKLISKCIVSYQLFIGFYVSNFEFQKPC